MPVARRHPRLAARRARAHVARHAALAVFAALATVFVLAPAAASAAVGGTTEVAPSVAAAASPALAGPPPPAALIPPPLAFAAATSSGYAPLGDVSRDYAFSDQRMTATAVDRPGRRAALIGAVGVGVTGDTPLRAGGGGAVTISLTHQVDRRVTVRDARVAVAIPSAYRPGRVAAPGWQCAPIRGRTLRCLAPGAVAAGQHAAIRLGLVARHPGRAHVRVRASWRERGAQSRSRARAAAANRLRTATGSATFNVRPPLRLRVTTAQRRVLGDGVGVDSAPIVLTGRLKRYDAGIPVDFRWRQLCGGAGAACPRVRWQSATSGRAAGRLVTAQADAPAVTRPTRLRFALSARDWRGAAQATATVVVLPQGQVKLAAGDEAISVEPRRRTPRTRGYVMRRRVVRTLELTGSALAGPRPGQRVELRALPQGGTLQHIRWTVVARGAHGTLRGTATNRETLSFVVPRRRTLTVVARAVISGTVVRTRRTVYILHADHTPRRSGRRRAVRAAIASAAADGGTFCTLWGAATAGADDAGTADAPIVLGGETAKVVLGDAVASGADCTADDARIAFDDAQVSVGDISFQDVEGTVTARGISLDAGWLGLPEGWWSDMPQRLRVTPGPAGTWGADLGSDDAWAPLHAQIALDDGVELLPLPEGWTFRPGESTLQYIPSTRTFALHSVAQAPAGQTGTVALDGSITLDGTTRVTVRADRVVELDGVDGRIVTLSGTGTLQTDPDGADDSDRDRGDEPGYDGGEASGARAASAGGARNGPRARAATGMGDEGSSLTGSIELRTDPAGGAIPLTSSVAVSNAVARWDSTGIEVSADVSVRSSRGTFAATARGLFESTSEWRLEIAQSAPFPLGDGVTLTDVVGAIQRTPLDSTDPSSGDAAQLMEAPGAAAGTGTDAGGRGGADARGGTRPTARASQADAGTDTFLVSLAGTVRDWSPSSALTDVEVRGAITNMCTPDEPACSTREVRLALEVRGNAHVRDQTIPWYGIAGVNLSTFAVRFEGGATLSDFGPDALHLDDVQLRLSTNGPAWCTPAGAGAATAASAGATTAQASQPAPGSPAPAASLRGDQELTFSISAAGRLLGEPFTAAGEFARSGYCLAGTFGEFTPDGLPGGSGRRPLVDDVRFAYASKDADIALAGRTLRLRAGDVRLSGALNLPPERLPAQLRDVLGGRADLSLLLTRTGSGLGLSGAARFTFAQPQYLLGSAARADQARLSVTSVDLSFDYSATTSLRLEMAAKAALQTPANDAKGIAASRTPLFLAAGVNLGMPSINVSAGVDTTDPALTDGTVRNAFGQQGLDVRRLLVSASIGADTSIGIAADATLPDGWTGALGMPARTPAKVTLSVSQTAPCLELEIGRMADPGAAVAAQPVLKLGPLAANWAQIVVAPMGCTIGNPSQGKPGYQIDPGFALGFDGQVGPTPVTFAASMRKYGTADFAVRGTVRVGAFDAGPVSFRRTSLDLDLDTGGANRHFDVAFAGGLDAGQSTIDVEGRFAASDTAISAVLRGNGRLRFADTTFAQGSVDARLEFAKTGGSWTAKAADVSARTQILGAEAGLLLSYRDGSVATAAGAFQYYASVGPLGMHAGALFAYSPDGVRLDGNPNDCSISRLTPVRDGKELIVRLCSWMQLGPLSHSMTLNVALPQQWDFDFYVPRSEVGIYVASVYMQGELHASLRVGLSGLNFWVRGGNARAGGCINMVFWSDCANGVYVGFQPPTGRFEGHVLGFPVSWGSDSWRTSPAPSGPDPVNNSPVGAGDRVLTQRAARVAFETKPVGDAGAAPRRTEFEPPRGGVPAQAVFDPERRQVTVMLPVPASVRAGLPRPTRAYMLTFSGVAFRGDDPVSSPGVPAWGGGVEPLLSSTGVEVGRVPDAGVPVTRRLDRPGAFVLANSGRRFVWTAPPAAVPEFVAAGLPTSFTVDLASAARTPESRAALMKSLG